MQKNKQALKKMKMEYEDEARQTGRTYCYN
jgi:hypothetical protein